jgi:hypothetical protein
MVWKKVQDAYPRYKTSCDMYGITVRDLSRNPASFDWNLHINISPAPRQSNTCNWVLQGFLYPEGTSAMEQNCCLRARMPLVGAFAAYGLETPYV